MQQDNRQEINKDTSPRHEEIIIQARSKKSASEITREQAPLICHHLVIRRFALIHGCPAGCEFVHRRAIHDRWAREKKRVPLFSMVNRSAVGVAAPRRRHR